MIFFTRAAAVALMIPLLALAGCLGSDSTDSSDGFSITIPSDNLTILPGSSTQTTVIAQRSGAFTGPIAFQAASVPTGITVKFTPDTIQQYYNSTIMTISADSTLSSGTVTMVLVATADPKYLVNISVPLAISAPTVSSLVGTPR